ncbi:ABC transporter F family member 4-like [Branchiostoma lanceolatum]|uniref:ABC transporter F family member 4-like n=1 Tax=Branchiostoma lanceolatum TaxID=7740 RepID=UPI0034567EB3
MAESFFWKEVENLKCPPISRCPFSGDKGSVQVFADKLVGMETFLLRDPYLKFEQSVLTRVLYKLSASLRRNKHYQYLKMVEKTLCKLARLELVTAVSHVSSCCPSCKDGSAGGAAVLMPSRQLVEFLLVKLLGAAELTKRTISLCAEAFILIAQQITRSLFLAANCTLLSITSRLWALLKSLQEQLQEWYSFIRPWVDKLQGTQVQWLPEGVELPLDLGEWLAPEEDTTQQQSRMQTSLSSINPKALGFLDHLFTSPVPSPDDRDCPTDPNSSTTDTSATEKPVSFKKSKVTPVAQSTPAYGSPFLTEEGLPNDVEMDLGEPVWSDVSSIRNRSSRHMQEDIVVPPTKLNFGEDSGENDSREESSKSAGKRKKQTKKEADAKMDNLEDVTHPAKKRKRDRDTKEMKEDKAMEFVQNLVKGKKRNAKEGNIQETQCKKSKSKSREEVENTQKERTLYFPTEEDTPSKKKRNKKTKAKVSTKDDETDSHKPLNKQDDLRVETCKRKQLDKDIEISSTSRGKECMVNSSSTFEDLSKCCELMSKKVQEEDAVAKLQKLSLKIKKCAKMESKGKMVKFDLKHMKSKVLRLAQTVGQLEQSTPVEKSEKEVRHLQAVGFKDSSGLMKKGQDTTFSNITENAKGTTAFLSPENANTSPVVPSKPIQVTPELSLDKKQDVKVKKKKKRAGKGGVKKEKKAEDNLFAKDDVLLNKKKKACSLNDIDEIDDIFRGLD